MRIKIFLMTLFLSFCSLVMSQFSVKQIDTNELPEEVTYKGDFVSAISWKDKGGLHYVIQAETPMLMTNAAREASLPVKYVTNPNSGRIDTIRNYEIVYNNGVADTVRNIEADYRIKALNVYHYVVSKKETSLVWKDRDFVSDCAAKNLTINFFCDPIVTDIDKDKIGEIWIMFRLGCRANNNVPLAMKQWLYMGTERYSMRGLQAIKRGEKLAGGEVRQDDNYRMLPPDFKAYSKKLWMSYMFEVQE